MPALFYSLLGLSAGSSCHPENSGSIWILEAGLIFLEGLRYLRHEPFILVVAVVKAGGALVWGAINVLEIIFAEEVFDLGDNQVTAGPAFK